jgi:hypothetical protein
MGRPILLTRESTGDAAVHALTEAGVGEILNRPMVSTELAAALSRCLHAP